MRSMRPAMRIVSLAGSPVPAVRRSKGGSCAARIAAGRRRPRRTPAAAATWQSCQRASYAACWPRYSASHSHQQPAIDLAQGVRAHASPAGRVAEHFVRAFRRAGADIRPAPGRPARRGRRGSWFTRRCKAAISSWPAGRAPGNRLPAPIPRPARRLSTLAEEISIGTRGVLFQFRGAEVRAGEKSAANAAAPRAPDSMPVGRTEALAILAQRIASSRPATTPVGRPCRREGTSCSRARPADRRCLPTPRPPP